MLNQRWLAVALLAAIAAGAVNAEANCDTTDKCAARVCEIDAAIDAARKEGSMRKVATLKDLRAEALRCSNKSKSE